MRLVRVARRKSSELGDLLHAAQRRTLRRASRRWARWRPITIQHDEIGHLLFGQHHLGSRDFFTKMYGQAHSIPLADLPHTVFLLAPDRGVQLFEEYLDQSWSFLRPDSNTGEERRLHMQRFLERYDLVKHGHRIERPALGFQRRDGRIVLIDGNHRAAIAYALGMPMRLELIPGGQWLSETVRKSTEFFGAGHRSMPYQSLYDRERELVRGRRRDTISRLRRVRADDLTGCTVLDLGSNVGATAFAAIDRGADRVIGLEYDATMVSSAIRANAYFASNVEFLIHDLNSPFVTAERYDTIFCFSVVAHLKTMSGLEETIRRSGARVMYFEGHTGTTIDSYPNLLSRVLFQSIEIVGHSGSGSPGDHRNRPFFRCVV